MHLFKTYKYQFILLFLWLILLIANYQHGFFLSGWDNLQTELNPVIGIQRAFFSAWQEYQSMGLLAGMGHAADLVRAIVVYFLTFILPVSAVRYTVHMSMFLIAALGAYTLFKFILNSRQANNQQPIANSQSPYAFAGSIFYVLNFFVLQILYLPFEPFSIFFAALPWELWVFFRFLAAEKNPLKLPKEILLFLLVNFLATPQSVAQQLFVVYMLLLGGITAGKLITDRSWMIVRNGVLALFLILSVNSFWLLPQLYFLKTSESVVPQAKINQLATDDVFYSNKDKGNLKDFLSFNGFFYDRTGQNQVPLFTPWREHRESTPITILIYSLSAITMLGLFSWRKHHPSFLIIFFLVTASLLIATPPFDRLNEIIRSNSFINQVFRSPFTKFAIPYALIAGYFFVSGLTLIEKMLRNWVPFHKKASLRYILVGLVTVLLVVQALPAFTGNYFASEMKVTIPDAYFSAIDYFKHADKNRRIALLPEYTFWGWFYHKWGYDGSGFLWYGVEQPIISRTFDVWSKTSESYYWEVKTALEDENVNALENVLEKYDVDYILFDHSLFPIVSSTKAIQYDRIEQLLAKSSKVSLEKRWDFISLYKVSHKKKIADFVSLAQNLPNAGPAVALTNGDTAYQAVGDYTTEKTLPYDRFYPFLDLTAQTRLTNPQWALGESEKNWYLYRQISFAQDSYTLSSPSGSLDINLYTQNTPVKFVLPYSVTQQGKQLVFQFPKVKIDEFIPKNATLHHCKPEPGEIRKETQGNSITVTAQKSASACFSFEDATLDQRYGYIVKLKNSNTRGQRLFFYILDKTKEQPYLEARLFNNTEYFIVGSRYQEGLGYSFNFQDTSLATVPAVNTLDLLDVYLMPYDLIKTLSLNSTDNPVRASFLQNFSSHKDNYYQYRVTIPPVTDGTVLILHQSFHQGWKAYEMSNGKCQMANVKCFLASAFPFLFGKELKGHVLVNNWENGWKLDSTIQQSNNPTIIILFWPQYLEYAGFLLGLGVLLLPIILLFVKRTRS